MAQRVTHVDISLKKKNVILLIFFEFFFVFK